MFSNVNGGLCTQPLFINCHRPDMTENAILNDVKLQAIRPFIFLPNDVFLFFVCLFKGPSV